MDKTIFEKIILGEIPCFKVYEDETTFAFLDINPKSPGHTLVIPKKHYRNIHDLPDDISAALFISVKKIASAVKEVTNCDGIKIIMNNEAAAGQVIFHAHVHIIPHFDNAEIKRPKNYKYFASEAEGLSAKIQKLLK